MLQLKTIVIINIFGVRYNIGDQMNNSTQSESLFLRCEACKSISSKISLKKLANVCPDCGNHVKLLAKDRINLIADEGTFKEINEHTDFVNPIKFDNYEQRHILAQKEAGVDEAVVTGLARINGRKAAIGVMESNFIMGSMGVILGEKVSQLFETAIEEHCPVILFTASGGARMQEGVASLFQMSKTTYLVGMLNKKSIPLFTVLTDPTTGGVTASFAMLGDIILAEPKALICFAGPRVIKQTINQELPEGFQRAEFLLEHGFIDGIVERKNMKNVLTFLLDIHKS